MTDEEIDKARGEEALQRWIIQETEEPTAYVIAAKLAREGWMPVDPLLIEARTLCAVGWDGCNEARIMEGKYDSAPDMKLALAALRRGIEIGKAS